MALKPEQLIAIGYLSQPKKGGKTIVQIAEECGVTEQTIYNWRKDPLFEKELKSQMVRNSQDKLPELIQSLSEIAIRDSNAAMAKLALQINGLLTDKVELETKGKSEDINVEEMKAKIEAFKKRKDGEN